MNILEISKSSSAKTEFSFFSVFFFVGFRFFQYRRRCRFRFFKISRYRFRFSVTDSALVASSLAHNARRNIRRRFGPVGSRRWRRFLRQSVLFATTLFRRPDERDYAPAFEPRASHNFNRRNHLLTNRRPAYSLPPAASPP